MLFKVKTKVKKLSGYKGLIKKELFREIELLAEKIKGLKIVHINSTSIGGGVAEILKSLIPLMKGVGLKADWFVIPQKEEFFEITKEIHNGLQGKNYNLSQSDKKKYWDHIKKTALMAKNIKADVWIIHDPQPAGIVNFLPKMRPAVSRIHIDTSCPNRGVWLFMKEILEKYDKIIFSAREFIQSELSQKKIEVFAPAIDPLAEKNKELGVKKARLILKRFGISEKRPLVSQVSRFDPWKDPLGSVEAYKKAKKEIPGLQLALVGLFLARDDPEAAKVFRQVKNKTKKDPDIFLFSEPNILGNLKVDSFVGACQKGSDIIMQKSIREGFGLVVAEAMWKQKAVIGGNVGGIKLQIQDKRNGFLVSSPKEAGERILELLRNKKMALKMGRAAKETVREKFLMPRLLRDYLKLFGKIL